MSSIPYPSAAAAAACTSAAGAGSLLRIHIRRPPPPPSSSPGWFSQIVIYQKNIFLATHHLPPVGVELLLEVLVEAVDHSEEVQRKDCKKNSK